MRLLLAALIGAVTMAALVAAPSQARGDVKARHHGAALQERARHHVVLLRRKQERKWRRLLHRRARAVRLAEKELGVPYVWGGASPRGFDCSGLVVWVMRKLGIRLPHHAASQLGYGRRVSRAQLRPGDLVYFNGAEHMGMYIGHGRFIHAPHTGAYVQLARLSDRQLYAARRVIRAQ